MLILALVFMVWTAAFAFLVTRAYKRATPERAFVRSGMGGTKVVINGGVIVFPHLNDITWVGMSAMEIRVKCFNRDALPFQDGELQCDVDFVLRVAPCEEAVLVAASTWGEKTLEAVQLQPLVEGRLQDAVRTAAAQRTLAQANADRSEFIRQTQLALDNSFTNGLLLESIRFE